MSLFSRVFTPDGTLIPRPGAGAMRGSVRVTEMTALRHSAVWACLRLRADLISTMPVDVFRRVGGMQVEVAKPPVLLSPDGGRMKLHEWMYATQVDLDRAGNTFGLITARDGLGRPARIELQELAESSVVVRDGLVKEYRFRGKRYDVDDVWHERQFVLAGLQVGLSPVAYAAWSIGQYMSAQQFALDWFGDGTLPAVGLRNTKKALKQDEANEIKARYKATVRDRDVFVHGHDWELKPIDAANSAAGFIETQQYGIPDIARFFGCPARTIDGAVSGQSVTYANLTQDNLQLLIHNIGPAVFRREQALTDLVPTGRYVKINADALLRMDPQMRAQVLRTQIEARTLAPSEARELDNRAPFTAAQIAEFEQLFGAPRQQPTTATSGATP